MTGPAPLTAPLGDQGLPGWLRPLAAAVQEVPAERLSPIRPPLPGTAGVRESAVLVLFGEGEHGPDLLITERSHDLRSHAGQPAFPGGEVDPQDEGPISAALREAAEETGVDPAGVQVFAVLPELYLPPARFLVTPVLGWWFRPVPVHVVNPAEVASVHRVPLATLADPANRLLLRHPSGYVGEAFSVVNLLVWGFTAGIIARLVELGGWERSWDRNRVQDLPEDIRRTTGYRAWNQ